MYFQRRKRFSILPAREKKTLPARFCRLLKTKFPVDRSKKLDRNSAKATKTCNAKAFL